MSETAEVVQDAVKQLLERLDALAAKLGIAAEQIWKFTVAAMAVHARRDLAICCALLLLPVFFFGWSLHVGFSRIPREMREVSQAPTVQYLPCDQIGMLNGKQQVLHEQCQVFAATPGPKEVQGDISIAGWFLIVSAVITGIMGIFILCAAVEGIIDALASMKTVEYDAFYDLTDRLKNLAS